MGTPKDPMKYPQWMHALADEMSRAPPQQWRLSMPAMDKACTARRQWNAFCVALRGAGHPLASAAVPFMVTIEAQGQKLTYQKNKDFVGAVELVFSPLELQDEQLLSEISRQAPKVDVQLEKLLLPQQSTVPDIFKPSPSVGPSDSLGPKEEKT